MTSYLKLFAGDLKRAFLDLSIIVGVVAFFQFVILREVPMNWESMVIGMVIVGIGLALFLRGLEIGVFPLGETLAQKLAASGSRFWIILFAFIIGFSTTIAEPALIAIADKAATISSGAIDAGILRIVVALSVGGAIVLGVVRIMLNHPIHWYIISGYVAVLAVTYFAPAEIIGLAYDSGGVTTSTVTVPLIAALGIGLASSLKNRNPVIDGFGLIAFASLTPMIFVQLYGIMAYTVGSPALPNLGAQLPDLGAMTGATAAALFGASAFATYGAQLLTTVFDVLPIILTIFFFYYVVLRKRIPNTAQSLFGFALAILGLWAFVIGLEIGLFPVGESLATSLATGGSILLVYAFAFAIGFATTLAEPSLSEIARKAQDISGGAINAFVLRLFVAGGVGLGILLGTYRIVQGDSIVWYIMAGYAVVVIMTFFAPRTIIPVAYDSGGVTTSTVTVPIVAALGLGLAAVIPERDPLIDGFGLIAFASLFPMITVLSYGIIKENRIRRYEKKLESLSSSTTDRILKKLQKEDTPMVSRTKKEIITITGRTGSGISSTARTLAEKLRYHYFSSGQIFEAVASQHGVTPQTLAEKAETNPHIDEEIDALVQELGIKYTRLVVDSKLAYNWINRSFKVYLDAAQDVRAQRIHSHHAAHGTSATLAAIGDEIDARHESKKKRCQELYGIDIENTKPFDLVLDTSTMTPDDIVDTVLHEYQVWLKNKK